MSVKAVMLAVLLACVLVVHGAARPMTLSPIRGLLGATYLSPDQVMMNNQRAQAATAQEIERAVDEGAPIYRVNRAARVGSLMSWASASAAANPNGNAGQATFDTMERLAPYLP